MSICCFERLFWVLISIHFRGTAWSGCILRIVSMVVTKYSQWPEWPVHHKSDRRKESRGAAVLEDASVFIAPAITFSCLQPPCMHVSRPPVRPCSACTKCDQNGLPGPNLCAQILYFLQHAVRRLFQARTSSSLYLHALPQLYSSSILPTLVLFL